MGNIQPAAPAAPAATSDRLTALEIKVETLLAKAESEVKTGWTKFTTWLKDNVVHLAGYSGVIAAIVHRL